MAEEISLSRRGLPSLWRNRSASSLSCEIEISIPSNCIPLEPLRQTSFQSQSDLALSTFWRTWLILARRFVYLVGADLARRDLELVRFAAVACWICICFSVGPPTKDSNVTHHVQLCLPRVIRQIADDISCRVPSAVGALRADDGKNDGGFVCLRFASCSCRSRRISSKGFG